jgi:outer membrane protein assembly factor BamA
VKRTTLALGLFLMLASPSRAQLIPELPLLGPDWTDLAFPKLYWTPTLGLGTGLYYAQIKQLGYDDWDDPAPFKANISLDFNLTTSGTRRIELRGDLPKLIDGWRFIFGLEGRRDSRERYFGIGNDSEFDKTRENDTAEHYYRSDNYRYIARTEVQRRIVGGLRLLAGFQLEQWRVDTLPGVSQLAIDRANGVDATIGNNVVDIPVRVGLVFDTRNDEPAPTRGLLLEAIVGFADSAVAGDVTYTRATASATGYLELSETIGIAARIAGQSMVSGDPPLGTFYQVEASDRPFYGLGGAESHRAIPRRRLVDADKLIANFDVRYTLMASPTLFRVTAIGFLDAGRVFPAGDFELTTDDLMVGGGLGFFIHLFRTAIFGTTAGVGPDGVIMNFHTWWPF